MHSAVMGAADSRLPTGLSRTRSNQASARFFRLAELRRLRKCEQVAAVCYRVRGRDIEFLLVQTRKGRWTFPKGSAMPGLTHAQAAALEAFEEAGVHGRMEEASFARYVHPKGGNTQRSVVTEITVSAHLCEVLRLGPPQEFDRNPTWFPADKAKKRLRDDRPPDFGSDLARVVDRAINRVRRLRSEAGRVAELPRKAMFIDIGKIRAATRAGTSRTG